MQWTSELYSMWRLFIFAAIRTHVGDQRDVSRSGFQHTRSGKGLEVVRWSSSRSPGLEKGLGVVRWSSRSPGLEKSLGLALAADLVFVFLSLFRVARWKRSVGGGGRNLIEPLGCSKWNCERQKTDFNCRTFIVAALSFYQSRRHHFVQ